MALASEAECVLDSSMALTWCLPNQASPVSLAVLKRVQAGGALVPVVWHIEMANILGLKARSGFLSSDELHQALSLLHLLPIVTDQETSQPNLHGLLALMEKYRLTAYDATYLDLARRRDLPLATFDKEMIASARQNQVALAGVV
jgi:predicted nucleic acid-binding protein